VVLVDDHLALLAVAGTLGDLGPSGPVVTTYSFQYRMARAVADSTRSGTLSRRLADPSAALRRVLHHRRTGWWSSTPVPASRNRFGWPAATERIFCSRS